MKIFTQMFSKYFCNTTPISRSNLIHTNHVQTLTTNISILSQNIEGIIKCVRTAITYDHVVRLTEIGDNQVRTNKVTIISPIYDKRRIIQETDEMSTCAHASNLPGELYHPGVKDCVILKT